LIKERQGSGYTAVPALTMNEVNVYPSLEELSLAELSLAASTLGR
jgi:hypothetical protein